MHKVNPRASNFIGFTSGGARSVVEGVDDGPLMQEMKGSMMQQEAREKVEAPQNYGFTSVVAEADKSKDGNKMMGAEAFMMFPGGNRSFPVAAVMDDRRHRLKNLAKDASKGSVAMHGLKEWGQQMLMCAKGVFITGNVGGGKSRSGEEKPNKIRLQLVKNKNEEEEKPGQFAAEQQTQTEPKKATGQKSLHKEDSSTFIDIQEKEIHTNRGNGNNKVLDDKVIGYHEKPEHSYRADKEHVHIYFDDNHVWVDKKNIYSSKPIIIKRDECKP